MKQIHGGTYDPEAITLLLSALDEAWERCRLRVRR